MSTDDETLQAIQRIARKLAADVGEQTGDPGDGSVVDSFVGRVRRLVAELDALAADVREGRTTMQAALPRASRIVDALAAASAELKNGARGF